MSNQIVVATAKPVYSYSDQGSRSVFAEVLTAPQRQQAPWPDTPAGFHQDRVHYNYTSGSYLVFTATAIKRAVEHFRQLLQLDTGTYRIFDVEPDRKVISHLPAAGELTAAEWASPVRSMRARKR